MFLGDQLRDEVCAEASFENLGSAPPSMEAARFLDAHSLQEGYCQTQSDAYSAYTQSWLGGAKGKGTPTFVELPEYR